MGGQGAGFEASELGHLRARGRVIGQGGRGGTVNMRGRGGKK